MCYVEQIGPSQFNINGMYEMQGRPNGKLIPMRRRPPSRSISGKLRTKTDVFHLFDVRLKFTRWMIDQSKSNPPVYI